MLWSNRIMKCFCGSGKHAKNCHGSDLSKGKIRHLLKYDLFKIENNKAWINLKFPPKTGQGVKVEFMNIHKSGIGAFYLISELSNLVLFESDITPNRPEFYECFISLE